MARPRPALPLLLALAGCGESTPGRPLDPALTGIELTAVAPDVLLPGTTMRITGESFVPEDWGAATLTIDALGLSLRLRYVDPQTLELPVSDEVFAALGGDGAAFDGEVAVAVSSAVDGRLYRTAPRAARWSLASELAPRADGLLRSGVIFANEPLAVVGSGLLLPGEGETVVELAGCFAPAEPAGAPCAPVAAREVAVTLDDPLDRTRAHFAFVPEIAGIEPGHFEGTVLLRNHMRAGTVREAPALTVAYDLQRPLLYGTSVVAASLGQYVVVDGAGFVGGDGATLLDVVGSFTTDADGSVTAIDEVLLPEFVDGRTVRYVLDESDALGQLLDLRYQAGRLQATVTPRIAWGDSEVIGDPAAVSLQLLPVRQVVWVQFLPAYVESLRLFGLRAVDAHIRARVFEVLRRDYATIGVELREQPPTDFAAYAQIDVGGPDPNGLGLFGYDNTPGKDTENQRLYDRIGGVNAQTQQDGYPGYGGVFIESVLGFSEHAGDLAMPLPTDPRFDRIFDPFRPDVGGRPVDASDLADEPLALPAGDGCPASDRPTQIACAIWVLGNIVGSTLSHELGHSLGLADPYGPDFHDAGEQPDRLMDADRPFGERAQLDGEGPSRFCDDEYAYLRAILPTPDADDPQPRPPCD